MIRQEVRNIYLQEKQKKVSFIYELNKGIL